MFCAPFIKQSLVQYALCLEIVTFQFLVRHNKPLDIVENANTFCVNAIVCSCIIRTFNFGLSPFE